MLRRFHIANGKVAETDLPEAPILVYSNPDEAEKRQLVESYKLDEHTLSSSLDPDELARMEFEPEHVAMIFKRAKSYCSEDNFLFKVLSTGVFLFKDKLIIVMADDAWLFEGRQFARVANLHEVLLKLVYRSIFHFLEHLKVINTISTSLEHLINRSMENRYLLNMFTLEKSLVYYLNAINSNGVLIERLRTSAARIGFSTESVELMDDMAIENSQCYKQAEIHSNILASLMDARASIVANNLNVIMKTLTLITIGIMIPTLVVSAFSMNVWFPLRDDPRGFWWIMAMALGSSAATFLLFRKFIRYGGSNGKRD